MAYRFMLDTNVISDLIKDPMGKVARQLESEGESSVCSSIIVASELRYGVAKSGSKELSLRVDAALSAIDILPFDIPADTEYGKLRALLAAKGNPIGPNDLLIAAHALSLGLTLVTDNVREFKRAKGLSVVNWRR
ncbi:type II toxin-antitoxin system VapC family toxin [Granulosicoccus sp.]|nr:type II toxin-antitoxin system VapC family toxin [Granulosicoccus sp.]MDB4224455.1 type II toxin-antitoxin system VapC family toxin [Granulosicoccus sp.]